MDQRTLLSALPMTLRWDTPPLQSSCDSTGRLVIEAGPGTDLFVDPGGDGTVLNAPRLVGRPPDGDFQFSARVTVGFTNSFDAGGLLLWVEDSRWAKLCFERSPAGENMVVSVVNRRCSDDANGFVVDAPAVWLRLSRLGRATAFHASTDGQHWQLIRHFDLGTESVQIGFESQAPLGSGCVSVFDDVRFLGVRLADLRDGR